MGKRGAGSGEQGVRNAEFKHTTLNVQRPTLNQELEHQVIAKDLGRREAEDFLVKIPRPRQIDHGIDDKGEFEDLHG